MTITYEWKNNSLKTSLKNKPFSSLRLSIKSDHLMIILFLLFWKKTLFEEGKLNIYTKSIFLNKKNIDFFYLIEKFQSSSENYWSKLN